MVDKCHNDKKSQSRGFNSRPFKIFPFVTADKISNLKAEFPAYLAKAEDFDDTVGKIS